MIGIQTGDIRNKNYTVNSLQDTVKLDPSATSARFAYIEYTMSNNPAAPGSGADIRYPLITVNHNLGYIPFTLVWIRQINWGTPTNGYTNTEISFGGGLGNARQYFSYYVDTSKLVLYYGVSTGTVSVDVTGYVTGFKYLINNNENKLS